MPMNYGWIKLTPQQAADVQTIKDANPGENFPSVRQDAAGDYWTYADLLQQCNWSMYPLYSDFLHGLYDSMIETSEAGQLASPTWPPPLDI